MRNKEPEILIPLIFFVDLDSSSRQLRPSVINKNKKGNKGHQCLNPLEALTNLDGTPFTNTT